MIESLKINKLSHYHIVLLLLAGWGGRGGAGVGLTIFENINLQINGKYKYYNSSFFEQKTSFAALPSCSKRHP